MSDQHSSPIKTPQQLVTVIVLAFVVPVLLIVLLVKFVVGEKTTGAGSNSTSPEAIAERLKPIGAVALADAGGGMRALQSGEAVYKLACAACHSAGVAGAPKTGDTGQWSPRLKQGFDTLVKHAVDGFKGMPAKGGNADLDPVEVARAVAYMGNQIGGKFKEPAAATAASTGPIAGAERTGEQIVQQVCGACHTEGKGGAPKIGAWEDWKPRVAKGLAPLTAASIKGHKGMPARGGMADITDAEMRRAVEYLFQTQSKSAASAAPVAAVATAAGAPKSSVGAGENLYKQACTACHAAGVAGAPKTGDKAAWAPRVKQGVDALVATVIKGKGAMPPRGAAGNASDAEIRAAVEYLVAQAK